jgi:phosphocarrier protein
MLVNEVEIINKLGLHARAAAKFVSRANEFDSEVHLERAGKKVNGKSIMGVMMLAAARGTRLQLYTEGADEVQAMESIQQLIADRFGEAE